MHLRNLETEELQRKKYKYIISVPVSFIFLCCKKICFKVEKMMGAHFQKASE